MVDYKISSFLVDDINNDDSNDLIISIDIFGKDTNNDKTMIIRGI